MNQESHSWVTVYPTHIQKGKQTFTIQKKPHEVVTEVHSERIERSLKPYGWQLDPKWREMVIEGEDDQGPMTLYPVVSYDPAPDYDKVFVTQTKDGTVELSHELSFYSVPEIVVGSISPTERIKPVLEELGLELAPHYLSLMTKSGELPSGATWWCFPVLHKSEE